MGALQVYEQRVAYSTQWSSLIRGHSKPIHSFPSKGQMYENVLPRFFLSKRHRRESSSISILKWGQTGKDEFNVLFFIFHVTWSDKIQSSISTLYNERHSASGHFHYQSRIRERTCETKSSLTPTLTLTPTPTLPTVSALSWYLCWRTSVSTVQALNCTLISGSRPKSCWSPLVCVTYGWPWTPCFVLFNILNGVGRGKKSGTNIFSVSIPECFVLPELHHKKIGFRPLSLFISTRLDFLPLIQTCSMFWPHCHP